MEKFAVIARPDGLSAGLKKTIIKQLTDLGRLEDEAHPDTVFVVGGDGTFIFAVHHYLKQLEHVRFYGIHTGTLGFYTDYKDDDLAEFLNVYLKGGGQEVKYPLLAIRTAKSRYWAINEMRIENAARTQEMKVLINGQMFEEYRGTGICVATQLGSTAYNRSLGGAVVQEGLSVLQMSEISGIHHSQYRSLGSSLVMQGSTKIEFTSDRFDGALLGVDSDVYEMTGIQEVNVEICQDRSVRMLRGRNVSYFSRLKSLF